MKLPFLRPTPPTTALTPQIAHPKTTAPKKGTHHITPSTQPSAEPTLNNPLLEYEKRLKELDKHISILESHLDNPTEEIKAHNLSAIEERLAQLSELKHTKAKEFGYTATDLNSINKMVQGFGFKIELLLDRNYKPQNLLEVQKTLEATIEKLGGEKTMTQQHATNQVNETFQALNLLKTQNKKTPHTPRASVLKKRLKTCNHFPLRHFFPVTKWQKELTKLNDLSKRLPEAKQTFQNALQLLDSLEAYENLQQKLKTTETATPDDIPALEKEREKATQMLELLNEEKGLEELKKALEQKQHLSQQLKDLIETSATPTHMAEPTIE